MLQNKAAIFTKEKKGKQAAQIHLHDINNKEFIIKEKQAIR